MMNTEKQRYLAVDVMRGLTLIAMIIVNDPGSWDHVFPPLLHAEWNGLTPTDYVYPFFLFIIGVSIALAYQPKLAQENAKNKLVYKIITRTLKIFALGIFLWLFPSFDFTEIRWAGVLQRIALVFLPCALLFLYTDKTFQIRLAAIILVFYWILMAYIPVPGIGAPDLSVPEKNWAHYLDSLLLPGIMWQKTWDPEGILSTLPAIVTGILGLIAGHIILHQREIKQKLLSLFFMGFILIALGDLWQWFFPINKNIWSSSYTCLMGGFATLTLAALIYLIDFKEKNKWIYPATVFGTNAITAYVLSGTLTVIFYNDALIANGLNGQFMKFGTNIGLAPSFSSFLYALFYVIVIFIPLYFLHKKKIFVKL
jgi:predicted acyltransferase